MLRKRWAYLREGLYEGALIGGEIRHEVESLYSRSPKEGPKNLRACMPCFSNSVPCT